MKNDRTEINQGGLFRCCIASWGELDPKEEAKPFKCTYCKEKISYEDGDYNPIKK